MSKNLFAYYGGKSNLIDTILPLIPQHQIYIEPFVGGASILFAKQRSKVEIINDINDNLINLYKVARHPKMSIHLIDMVNGSLHAETTHTQTRKIYRNPTKHNAVIRAWATWYQFSFSFGGTTQGGFAVKGTASLPKLLIQKKKDFPEIIKRLENVSIRCKDVISVISLKCNNTPDTFIYLDPPYFNSFCGHYKQYTETDFITLLQFLQNEFKGKFLLSSFNSITLQKFTLNNKWNTTEVKQTTLVNGKYTDKIDRTKTEVLTYNYQKPQINLF